MAFLLNPHHSVRQTSPEDASSLKVHLESIEPDLFTTGLDDVSVTRDDSVKVPSGDDFRVSRHGPEE